MLFSTVKLSTMVFCLQDWVSNVAGKQAAYHAMAEYYQGVVAKEKKEFGEEIARLAVSSIQWWTYNNVN